MIYYVFQFYVRIKIIFVYNPQFHEQGNIVYLTISNQSAIIHCKNVMKVVSLDMPFIIISQSKSFQVIVNWYQVYIHDKYQGKQQIYNQILCIAMI